MKTQFPEYEIYFNLLAQPFSDFNPDIYFLFVPLLALFISLLARLLAAKWGPTLIFLIFASGISWFGAYISKIDYQETKGLRVMLAKGLSEVVVGRISHFKPLALSRRGYESFEVEGIKFIYKDGDEHQGFARSKPYGKNILAEGMQVRIHYYQNNILRIEIAKTQ